MRPTIHFKEAKQQNTYKTVISFCICVVDVHKPKRQPLSIAI
jgi:hypothetical protein